MSSKIDEIAFSEAFLSSLQQLDYKRVYYNTALFSRKADILRSTLFSLLKISSSTKFLYPLFSKTPISGDFYFFITSLKSVSSSIAMYGFNNGMDCIDITVGTFVSESILNKYDSIIPKMFMLESAEKFISTL